MSSTIARLNLSSESPVFSINLDSGIPLKDQRLKIYEIALLDLTTTYNWLNISVEQDNNTLRYSLSSTYYTITIPDGLYSMNSLNSYLYYAFKADGTLFTDSLGNLVSPITFNIRASDALIQMNIIDNAYTVDFSIATGTIEIAMPFTTAS